MLLPLAAVSLLSAIAVAIGSYWQGDRWAQQQIAARYDGIAETLSGATFPINSQIIQLLADLTDTDLLALRPDGSISTASIKIDSRTLPEQITRASEAIAPAEPVNIGPDEYRFGIFARGGPGAPSANGDGSIRDDAQRIVVLFDETELAAARWRAAALPLVTGLSSVFLLTTVALFLVSRLIRRLTRLGQQVDKIAEGDFQTNVDAGVNDEVGLLGESVGRMSGQLNQMWQSLQRTQGEKLLHQIASGLAHQLRNSLTGARMAVELHSQKCDIESDETISVALSQLEQTEDSVRRLLLVAAGKQDADHPGSISVAIEDVRNSLSQTASHLKVEMDWDFSDLSPQHFVCDAPSLSAALSNLVLNAIQVARKVQVRATHNTDQLGIADQLRIVVTDDGPGPPTEIADELFEPFVTSKPEGLGLGLPLVARAAQRLGGNVDWQRVDNQTEFILTAKIVDAAN